MVQKRIFKLFATFALCFILCFATSACAKTSNLTKGQVIDLIDGTENTTSTENTRRKTVSPKYTNFELSLDNYEQFFNIERKIASPENLIYTKDKTIYYNVYGFIFNGLHFGNTLL
jgi:hypothetical protein